MPNALTIRNLKKTYADGTQAIQDVSLTIKKGEFYALLGANGAGKTTLIGILTDLVKKTEGEVIFNGLNLDTHINDIKNQIGVVPQEFNFNMFHKVINIVTQQGGYFGVPEKIALVRAEKILKKLSLWDKRNTMARSLSGGMKRRLMIARALIHEPEFLILDEPTAGVDVELRRSMWEYMLELNKSGVTILLTTHYLEEVEAMCSRMAMMNKGVVVKEGLVREIMQDQDAQQYKINVTAPQSIKQFQSSAIQIEDQHTLIVTLKDKQSIIPVLQEIEAQGLTICDISPATNRLESFFINTIQS